MQNLKRFGLEASLGRLARQSGLLILLMLCAIDYDVLAKTEDDFCADQLVTDEGPLFETDEILLTHDKRVFWKGSEVRLYKGIHWQIILMLLVEYPDEYVSVDDLRNKIWPSWTGTSRTLQNNVKQNIHLIRREFKKVDPDFSKIVSRYGLGYRWAFREQPRFISFGSLGLDPDLHLLKWKDQQVPLSIGQFALIEILLRKPGSFFLEEKIFTQISPEIFKKGIKSDEKKLITIRDLLYLAELAFQRVDPEFNMIERHPRKGVRWRESP
jgi:DNA-binding response OmpR family regulator